MGEGEGTIGREGKEEKEGRRESSKDRDAEDNQGLLGRKGSGIYCRS
jgi:hypothetical protein